MRFGSFYAHVADVRFCCMRCDRNSGRHSFYCPCAVLTFKCRLTVGLSHHACKRVSADMNALPVRVNASGVCPLECERIFCALVLGVSKHHFTQMPLSPYFQGSATKGSQRFVLKQQALWRPCGTFYFITLQQLWQRQRESRLHSTLSAYVWLFSRFLFPAQ